jgi:tetratricopeptide (TPR) repeat protein
MVVGMWLRTLGLSLLLTCAGPAWGADPASVWGTAAEARLAELAPQMGDSATPELKREAGILRHNLAVGGAKGEATQAVELLKPAVAALPEDRMALAFLGSAHTLIGRDASNPITKVDAVKKGIKLLDEAVEAAPESLEVRLVRASNSAALPAMFERGATFDTDVGFMMAHTELLDASPLGPTCYVLIGDFHKNKNAYGEAVGAWKKALEQAGEEGQAGRDAKERLTLFMP